MKLPIYLDYASTTPADPRVVKKMQDCLSLDGNFGNPASRSHAFGWKAEEATEEARQHVADLVNCDPREIVWTSGATESDNLAIKGAAKSLQKQSEENTNKVKLCKYFEVSYHFLEVSSGELILLGVNNREIKKVLPLIYENDEYKQYHFQNKNNSIQFIFYDDGRFILSEKRKDPKKMVKNQNRWKK